METNSNVNIIYIENNNDKNNFTVNNENVNHEKDKNSDEDNIKHNNDTCLKYKMYLSEGVGWVGSVLVLIPYVMTMNKTIDFVLNTLGASGLFIVCFTSKQYQSVIINAAWIVGGFYKYFYS